MIEVKELTRRYGRHYAVDGVSFNLEQGEVVGLLGPNGAGKTTLLRILLGQLQPDQGIIELGETVEFSIVDQRR